ncbi:Soluble inorganic pyrophosphatase 1 [Camellia lanceoleosa]|uniref:Soluble inorganic pyrophosphatase 1 n=1 Tax=Camellia lanceoleosa TaxID=1840588 RepID=A0ACC0G6A1_9ERIC|nr:Soluble inorganic pyrophosphatase 1 [Camellia lanceoleosa]
MNEGGESGEASGESSDNTQLHKIQRVPQMLRRKEEAHKYYDPQLVSIGPYYRNDANLKSFEEFKIEFTRKYVRSCEPHSIDELYDKVVEVAELRSLQLANMTEPIETVEIAYQVPDSHKSHPPLNERLLSSLTRKSYAAHPWHELELGLRALRFSTVWLKSVREASLCEENGPTDVLVIMQLPELLELGTNVNYQDIDDRTALHVAACHGSTDVVEFGSTMVLRLTPRIIGEAHLLQMQYTTKIMM